MKKKSIEVAQRKSIAIQKIIKRGRQRSLHRRRQFRTEDDTEAIVLYVPSHNVFGIAPTPFAAGNNTRSRPRAISGVVQQQAGSAIAEQSGGDEHCRTRIIHAQTQAAEINRQKQNQGAILGVGQSRSAGKARHSGAATKPEHRQPLNRGRQFEPVQQQGSEWQVPSPCWSRSYRWRSAQLRRPPWF